MGNHVHILENVETQDDPRILLENPETDDENCLPASDESGSDDEAVLGLQNVQLDETERAIPERLSSGPSKRTKFVSGDSHTATQPYFGLPTLDGLFESFRNEQDFLATQAQVSGSRVMARRVPLRPSEKEVTPYKTGYESALFNSCFKVLFEMTDGAYREKCPDLMEFLTEELTQVQKRYKVLVKVGSDAGYGSPEFQRAVEVWRNSLDMAIDPAYQAELAPEKAERVTCNDELSKRTLTAGGLSMGRESLNPMPQLVPNPVISARSPFTPSQWLEFEHQELIFKYMVAGIRLINVPDEILDPIRKSVASTNGTATHHAPNLATGAFHLSVANNSDPEPGRCRRTDGKKWRCARDIVPDKKYCERHMHRGRHRSRPAASSGQLQLQASQ